MEALLKTAVEEERKAVWDFLYMAATAPNVPTQSQDLLRQLAGMIVRGEHVASFAEAACESR